MLKKNNSPYLSSICFLDSGNVCGKLLEIIGFKEKGMPPESKNNLTSLRRSEMREFGEKKKRRRTKERLKSP